MVSVPSLDLFLANVYAMGVDRERDIERGFTVTDTAAEVPTLPAAS